MSGPTVTLTFDGDASQLTDAMSTVGSSAQDMATKVGSASSQMDQTGRSVDGLADSAGTGEQRFQGFSDVIVGTGDVMTGFREGDIVGMAQGFADIAGGLEGFLIPILGQLAGFLAGPLRAAMTFISSHPLLIVLGLLVVAFVTLWTTSETFRNIVIGVFNAVAGFIRDVFGGALGWIRDRWNDLMSFFSGLPRRIGDALGSIGNFIRDAFKGGLNVAIDFLNWGIDRINDLIHGINIINPFDDIPPIPHVPRLHSGGIMPGAPGEEGLALLRAGERVSVPGHSSGPGLIVTFSGDTDSAFATAFMALVRTGQIQLGPGT